MLLKSREVCRPSLRRGHLCTQKKNTEEKFIQSSNKTKLVPVHLPALFLLNHSLRCSMSKMELDIDKMGPEGFFCGIFQRTCYSLPSARQLLPPCTLWRESGQCPANIVPVRDRKRPVHSPPSLPASWGYSLCLCLGHRRSTFCTCGFQWDKG